MKRPLFRQVSIVGLGLIGGSLGLALREGRVARTVIGFSRRASTVSRAVRRGVIDDGDTALCPNWLEASDLVVIATPPVAVVKTAARIARRVEGPAVLTDVAGIKVRIVRELERLLPAHVRFVGGHPMAGSERSGIEAARLGLFEGALCLLTPTRRTDRAALARVRRLWRAVGSRPVTLTPQAHDACAAQISHMPHLAASAMALAPEAEALRFAATGFRDMTRLAMGEAAMWEEICRANRRQVLEALGRFERELACLKRLIAAGGGAPLRRRLVAARLRRKGLALFGGAQKGKHPERA